MRRFSQQMERRGHVRSRALVAMALIGAACVSGGWLVQRGARSGEVSGGRLFDQVRRRIANDYVDTLAEGVIYRRALDGMLRELGDPHTRFLSGSRLGQLQEATSGRYEGIGVRIDVRDGWPTVVAPLPGTPAERAGIQTGDRIVEIEGRATHGWSTDDAAQAIRGARGTRVSFVVERPGAAARIPFRVERREVTVRSVQHITMLRDRVGYVDVDLFSETTAGELARGIETLRARGMRALIVDLRGNPGGLLDQGVQVSDLFLDPGQTIVSMKGRMRDANRTYTDRLSQRWPAMPVAVLVDSGSASASEIVAGSLQDHDRAVVIGTATFGKGSAQSLFGVGDSLALKLTTARWFTPVGRSIDRVERTVPSDDDDDDGAAGFGADSAARPRFQTRAGRLIFGGGGIVPDLEVPEVQLSASDRRFQDALGQKIPAFRDALTSLALAARARGGLDPRFTVTPEMRDDLWRRMGARGIDVPRELFDAAPVVDRLLIVEIGRYALGDLPGFLRAADDDQALQTAIELAAAASSPRDIIERAAARRR